MKKKILTTAELITNMVPKEWDNYRKTYTREDGVVWELCVYRFSDISGRPRIALWACETYVKAQSKNFAFYDGTEWTQNRNRFAVVEY